MNSIRKIVLAGGSGFLGQALIDYWEAQPVPIDLVVLSRQAYTNHGRVRYIAWDGETVGPWSIELDGADVLINLAGKSVDCRYTEPNKRLIIESRIKSTTVLGEAIRQVANPPEVWINLASATIYRHSLDRPMDEATGESGSPQLSYRFSEQVCQAWEQAFFGAQLPATVRRVALRTSLVLGQQGGVFPVLRRLVRLGQGGQQGSGQQVVSWLHIDDFIRIVDFVITDMAIAGPVNATAPNPIRNRAFMALLRRATGVWIGLPATAWMLEIGAFFLRTETELVLKSRNVIPQRLLDAGFSFKFPRAEETVNTLVAS
ncbi:TIGR01777 family oxidoreductase [Spirosoma knui]